MGINKMGKIIITGVDGNFGGFAAKSVLSKRPKEDFIFTSPNITVNERFCVEGIDARFADYTNPSQLTGAFAGGETLLLISVPQVGEKRRNMHKNAIDAAVAAGVKRIVYTSIVGACDPENEAYEISDHTWTENYIYSTPLTYKILRNSQYCEAMVASFEQAAATNGVLANNMGGGKMAHISRDDCAEVASCAACGAGEDNKVYFINGPTANTMEEFVAIGSEVMGKSVTYQYITDEESWAFFDSKGVPRKTDGDWSKADPAFPFCSDGMVTFGIAIRKDQMSYCTKDFALLTGKTALSVRDVFADMENHRIGDRKQTD